MRRRSSQAHRGRHPSTVPPGEGRAAHPARLIAAAAMLAGLTVVAGPSTAQAAPRAVAAGTAAARTAAKTTTGAATADLTLVGASPSAGETVGTPPGAVQLTFSGQLASGSTLTVVGPDGAAGAGPVVNGSTLSTSLRAGIPAGTYVVAWRAKPARGRPLSGGFSFQVALTATPSSPGAASAPGVTTSPGVATSPALGGLPESRPGTTSPPPAAAPASIGAIARAGDSTSAATVPPGPATTGRGEDGMAVTDPGTTSGSGARAAATSASPGIVPGTGPGLHPGGPGSDVDHVGVWLLALAMLLAVAAGTWGVVRLFRGDGTDDAARTAAPAEPVDLFAPVVEPPARTGR